MNGNHVHAVRQNFITNFFGLSLAKTPANLIHNYGYLILLLPVVTALLQFVQTKMMTAAKSDAPVIIEKPKENKAPDFSQTLQTQMLD